MDLLFDTNIRLSGDNKLYIYDDATYQDSLTADSTNGLLFATQVDLNRVLLTSVESISETPIESFRQNSQVSPQDCQVCESKFRFGHPCLFYKISSTELSDLTSSDNTMSSALQSSSQASIPLEARFDTTADFICKSCINSLLDIFSALSSEPHLIASQL